MYGRISIIGGVYPRSYVFFQCTDPLTEDEDFSPIQLFSSLDQCLCAIDFRSRSEAECRGQLNQEFEPSRLGFGKAISSSHVLKQIRARRERQVACLVSVGLTAEISSPSSRSS